jgi:pimeloyl-ACP methyl ester carboxylesterase
VLVRINGLDTYYMVEGQGDPVVLLHGWGSSSQSFAPLCGALAGRFRVLALDLPGFGWSRAPATAWGTTEYAGHVEQLLQETGIGPAAIVGHSFGGRIAIALAARQPSQVSKLVLVASAAIRPRRRAGYYLRVATAKLAKRFFSLPVWGATGQRVLSRLQDRIGSRDYRSAGRMRATLVKVVNEDLTPVLPAVRVPTLILWGDRDQEVPRTAMEIMAAAIPRARLLVLEGAGHFPFLDMPEEFQRTLIGFLRAEDRR